MDSAQDARSEIFRAINVKRKKDTEEVFDRIIAITEDESKQKSRRNIKELYPGALDSHLDGCKESER